jgi:hypothetical protein
MAVMALMGFLWWAYGYACGLVVLLWLWAMVCGVPCGGLVGLHGLQDCPYGLAHGLACSCD